MKCVVITGSAGGIGAALVEAFCAAGYKVVGVDVRSPRYGAAHTHVQIDLDRFPAYGDYRRQAMDRVRAEIGENGLAALINNAAIQHIGAFESLTVEDWSRTMNVNVMAPMLLIRDLLPEISKVRGTVVNIASIHAKLTKPEFSAYATSKSALLGMTAALAVELGSRLQMMAICPAAIATPMLLEGFDGRPTEYDLLEQYHPSRSVGSPADLARLTLKLVETATPFHNGMIVNFDGGIASRLHDPA